MTPKQLERKARQLLHRRRLADTIEPLEDSIKAHMEVEGKEKVRTKSFAIDLAENELSVTLLPNVDPRQLKLELGKEGM